MKDYYQILRIPRSASKEEIKQAYRKLAHQYHPDKKGGDEQKFKEINEAYQVLGDERKKAHYDQFGSAFDSRGSDGFQGFDFRNFSGFGAGGFSASGGPAEGWDFGDIFSEFFGGGAKTSTKTRQSGADIEIDIILSLEEAFSGIEREIALRKYIQCPRCAGKKNEPGSSFSDCARCKGTGEIRREQRTFLGSFTQVTTCAHCEGAGKIAQTKCKQCGGAGRIQETEKILIKVPRGIENGQIVELKGKGEAGEGGYGNLYIEVHVREHTQFRRKGADIYSEREISLTQAVLGDTVGVLTLSGNVEVQIPAGIKHGEMIKLEGKGMARLGTGGLGDQYVQVMIKMPKRLSRKATELFEELKREGL
ncbi:MAG: molecular chaperone DnaJ [Candidatus Spechtbacteria bacterium]|nr:molecular chaperone DnaJ [Candidatus Spechtbacteria bacterium]